MTGQNKHQLDAERDKNRRQIRREWIGLALILLIGAALCLIEVIF